AFRLEEACEAYATAERLGMKGAQFLANWAAATLESGHVDEAAELYHKALGEDPMHEESRRALPRLAIEYRGGEGAFSHYESVARERPGQPKPWLDWAMGLIINYKNPAAREEGGGGGGGRAAGPAEAVAGLGHGPDYESQDRRSRSSGGARACRPSRRLGAESRQKLCAWHGRGGRPGPARGWGVGGR